MILCALCVKDAQTNRLHENEITFELVSFKINGEGEYEFWIKGDDEGAIRKKVSEEDSDVYIYETSEETSKVIIEVWSGNILSKQIRNQYRFYVPVGTINAYNNIE